MRVPFWPCRSAAEFFTERSDLLDVSVVRSNGGWDVVLRIDGTYTYEEDAVAAADGMRDMVKMIPDIAWKTYGAWGRWGRRVK